MDSRTVLCTPTVLEDEHELVSFGATDAVIESFRNVPRKSQYTSPNGDVVAVHQAATRLTMLRYAEGIAQLADRLDGDAEAARSFIDKAGPLTLRFVLASAARILAQNTTMSIVLSAATAALEEAPPDDLGTRIMLASALAANRYVNDDETEDFDALLNSLRTLVHTLDGLETDELRPVVQQALDAAASCLATAAQQQAPSWATYLRDLASTTITGYDLES